MSSKADKAAPLIAGIASYFNSDLYSDLEIRCSNGDLYAVHKVILCAQSEFFANACKPESKFKETLENVICLNEHDPAVVGALIEYFYRFDYTCPDYETEAKFHFHIQLYCAGDFYCVGGLKDLAAERFRELADKDWNPSGFNSAVRAIYDLTHEADRGLRDIAVDVVYEHAEEFLQDQKFANMMDEVGPFSKELAKKMHGDYTKKFCSMVNGVTKYHCPSCQGKIEMILPHSQRKQKTYCPLCAVGSPVSSWRSFLVVEHLDSDF